MCRTYAQLYCNIAASHGARAGETPNKQFFHTRTLEEIFSFTAVNKLSTRNHQGLDRACTARKYAIDSQNHHLLHGRVWVLQERN